MRRFLQLTASCLLLPMFTAAQADAQTIVQPRSQTKSDDDLKAYGSRIGDRDTDIDDTALIGNRRLNARLETRINSRLDTRLDRFVMPKTDDKSIYLSKGSQNAKAAAKPSADVK